MKIHKPKHLSIHANACLQALSESGLGKHISLGGAFGLSHYHEFRPTHDIDAWWDPQAGAAQQKAVIALVQRELHRFGAVKIRAWGDVTSLELSGEDQVDGAAKSRFVQPTRSVCRLGVRVESRGFSRGGRGAALSRPGKSRTSDFLPDHQVVFSFQIAARSAQLQPTLESPWKSVRLDSFEDLVASKMAALVERGAPRDFLDIHRLCHKGLLDPEQAWALWNRRVILAGGNADPYRALLAVATHLQRIILHRPLDKIPGLREQRAAIALRNWFAKDFLHALMD